jgi:hypothetical protein
LIAVGAILRYAVTVSIEGVELDTVGLILMIAGIIGLVIALAVTFMGSDRRADEYPPLLGGSPPSSGGVT